RAGRSRVPGGWGSRGKRRRFKTAFPLSIRSTRRASGPRPPPRPSTTATHTRQSSNADVKLTGRKKEPHLPHRAPGSPGNSRQNFLSGKPIRYYRPKGSADVRYLVEEGFQAFNAGRLSEACAIFADKMLAPEHDTTIGLTVAGAMTPAGLGGCVIEMMERGLIDFVISTGANLYHDLHYALNFTLRRGSPFVDDVALFEEGVIRIYDVLFPASVLLETDWYIRDFLVGSGPNEPTSTSEFHYRLGLDLMERYPGCQEHSVVARPAQDGVPLYTPSPGDTPFGMTHP